MDPETGYLKDPATGYLYDPETGAQVYGGSMLEDGQLLGDADGTDAEDTAATE